MPIEDRTSFHSKFSQYIRPPHLWEDESGTLCLCQNQPMVRQQEMGMKDDRAVPLHVLRQQVLRHPFRLAIWKPVGKITGPSQWQYVRHVVNIQAVAAETQKLPRYLFRVFNKHSAGDNKPGHFRSEREKHGLCGEIENMSEDDLKDCLLGHMASRKTTFASPWVSLSCSVLWVMAKALRLVRDGKQMSDLQIAIVDTLNLPERTYLYHAGALLRAYNVEDQMVYSNMGDSMVLVWRQLRAPMAVIAVKDFLPGYMVLQPFHLDSIDNLFKKHVSEIEKERLGNGIPGDNPKKHLKKQKQLSIRTCSRLLTPAIIRKKIFRSNTTQKIDRGYLKTQAPKVYYRKHVAKRIPNREYRQDPLDMRRGTSAEQLGEFVSFVKRNVSDVKFQLPILIFLFSTKINEIYRDAIVEQIRELDRDDPMIKEHNHCFVRKDPGSAVSVPEILKFESLYGEVCEELGITVRTFDDYIRNFGVFISSHTRVPDIHFESLQHADLADMQQIRQLREQQEAAKKNASREWQEPSLVALNGHDHTHSGFSIELNALLTASDDREQQETSDCIVLTRATLSPSPEADRKRRDTGLESNSMGQPEKKRRIRVQHTEDMPAGNGQGEDDIPGT